MIISKSLENLWICTIYIGYTYTCTFQLQDYYNYYKNFIINFMIGISDEDYQM